MNQIDKLWQLCHMTEKLRSLFEQATGNLRDAYDAMYSFPKWETGIKDLVNWVETNESWEADLSKRLCMLLDIQEVLHKEGFDRWTPKTRANDPDALENVARETDAGDWDPEKDEVDG